MPASPLRLLLSLGTPLELTTGQLQSLLQKNKQLNVCNTDKNSCLAEKSTLQQDLTACQEGTWAQCSELWGSQLRRASAGVWPRPTCCRGVDRAPLMSSPKAAHPRHWLTTSLPPLCPSTRRSLSRCIHRWTRRVREPPPGFGDAVHLLRPGAQRLQHLPGHRGAGAGGLHVRVCVELLTNQDCWFGCHVSLAGWRAPYHCC